MDIEPITPLTMLIELLPYLPMLAGALYYHLTDGD